jgi:hypothetical protein
MDNPYWESHGQEHYVNIRTVKSLCFELTNIFEASKALSEEMTASEYAGEEPAKIEKFPLVELHQELAFKKTSELLLQLALLVRTYDDQIKSSENSEKYIEFSKDNDSGDYIGTLQGEDKFYLRDACNKIIHAQEVRPLYERATRYVIESDNEELGQDVWYLTGEIELVGDFRRKTWEAVLHLQPYLETVLGLVKYGLPQ